MYVLLIILACLALLYVFQNKLESFVNSGGNPPQVKRVHVEKFTSNRNNQPTVKVESAGKTNKYGDEIYQCEGGPFKFNILNIEVSMIQIDAYHVKINLNVMDK